MAPTRTARTRRTALALATTCLTCLLLTALANAQERERRTLGPRSFFPIEYQEELFVDIEAINNSDVLFDALERSFLLATMTYQRSRKSGLGFLDFKHLHCASWGAVDSTGKKERATAFVLISHKPLDLVVPDSGDWRADRIGGHRVAIRNSDRQSGLFALPRPTCLVFGHEETLRPILAGQRRGGVPKSKLLAFMAGPKPILRWGWTVRRRDDGILLTPFPANWYHKDHTPRFCMLELLPLERPAKGDAEKGTKEGKTNGPKEDAVVFAVKIRFAKPGKGPKTFIKSLRSHIKRVQMLIFGIRGSLEEVEIEADDCDVYARVTLHNYQHVGAVVDLLSLVPRERTSQGIGELTIGNLQPHRWAACFKVGGGKVRKQNL